MDDHKADRDKAPARRRPARPRAARVVLLPQLMSLAAERAPSADAVTCEGRKRSYEDLDRQSSQLARMLIGRRIGPEGLVAVALARSIESVTSVWGIAKSGAAFVPIDPGYPEDRVLHMLTDSGVAVGITTAEFRDGLPATVEWIVLDDPDTSSAISKLPDDSIAFGDRLSQLRAEHPAYVIYTSGSTGRPKGVVVTQAGLGAFCAEQVERYQLTSASRTLHFASPSFDAAVLELLLAIGASSTMVIAPDTVFGGSELAALIAEERVTHGFITPAALASVDPSGLDSVEMIVVGGEACPPELVSRWGSKCRFHNGYGPTETTIMTNISEALQPGEPVTIGRGIRGVSNQILDARLGEVPQGVAGELYLAGPGLARGYHARPSLTAARFVANPFGAPGGRLYRTGDIVRSTPKNEVEYVGRNDFQVKIRGYRIELGEIDSVLVSHPDVDFAVTVGREIGTGAQILVSYVVPTVGSIVDTAALLEHVGQSVPGYMVPTTIAVIDKIPLTPVGKLDRAALPAPTLEHAEFIEPTAGLEQTVAEVFADVLDTSPIGAHDNFFELGGNSLMATSVTARLSSILGWRIGARELFSASTVAGLAARIEAMPAGDHKSKEIVARPRPARLPLSYAQQRMWFLGQFEASSAVYNVPLVVRLVGDLDTDAINAALADVISRHESLRTIYPTIDGEPVQQILDAGDAAIEIAFAHVDSTELVPNVAEVAGRGFDLAGEIPVRVSLFEVDPSDHVLAVVIHHIACDGSSLGPLARDVMIAYEARSRGESPAFAPLPVQYADYALRQLDLLGSATDPTSVAARQIAYWREALDGIPAVLDLPADRPRPSVQSNRGESLQFALDQGAHEQLYKLAREQNSTLFMVLHAAVAVLLARLSGSADIAVGTPIAGRGDKVLEGLIGMFVNTLVLRTEVDSNISFRDLVDNVRRTDVAAFDHAELPFEWLVDELAPTRSTAHSPLFQTLLVLQNFAQTHLELPGLTLRGVEVETELAKFDLQFTLEEQFDESGSPMGISGSIIFATDLFERETATRFAARFERIVESIIANVDRKVGDIDILDADERALLASYNDTAQPIAADVTLVSLFDDQVVRTPDAVAVVFENETLTYVDLDERANKIARHLISLGVGPEIVVGVAMNRSIELVVALYAILKAGGVYVPLDPDQPAERLAHVVESAGPRAVLVVSADEAVIPASVERIEIDRIALEHVSGSRISDAERTAALRPMNTAYLIYTSGSTGQPKGVALPHAATVSQLLWAQDRYPLDGTDVVLHKTPIVFDISIWEMLWTLHTGAVMVIAAPQGHKDPFYLSQMIERHSVTTVHFVPSMLDLYLATAPAVGASLRRVFAAGEALQSDLADRFAAQSSADLHNWYGPAEVEVITAWKRSRDEQRSAMPIGRPVWNSGVYVLDSRLSHVPAGVAGELYVSGVQLARGYFGRADLTGERFVANPFAVGERLYRTGDLVRWNRFGELEYLGRTDFQVKVRGQRVELGEIESVLLAAESVARAVVVARVDPRVGSQLVGYVVPVAGAVIDVRDLREFVGTRVPSYMVPSAVVVIDEFPLTASGKVDRRALPEPVFEVRAFRVPSTPVEEIVAGVFAELLGVERVGVNDDFFELGGNSLIATRVVARLGVALDARVPVRVLFEASTVEALAVRLERHVGRGGRVALGPRMRPERVPLSLAQQRMWFLNRLEPGSAVNNIPVAVRLSGALDIEALRAAISDVVERHEVLRTVYPAIDGVGVQVVVPTSQAVPDVVPATVVEGELLAAVAGLVGAGFDVTQAVPLRVGLFALG
ncbi:amino acid adenylation domain-containing protein, partial [Antrihabitans spumae]